MMNEFLVLKNLIRIIVKIMLTMERNVLESKYFIRSKFEIIETRSCVRCIVLQTFKEIGRAVKRRREATVDRVILYRSWISIGGMAFVRPIKTFPTTPSQLSRLLRLSRCLLFYYNIFYTTASFSRRVRGTRGLKSEGGRGHLKH